MATVLAPLAEPALRSADHGWGNGVVAVTGGKAGYLPTEGREKSSLNKMEQRVVGE